MSRDASEYTINRLNQLHQSGFIDEKLGYNNFQLDSAEPGILNKRYTDKNTLLDVTHAVVYWHDGHPVDRQEYEVVDIKEGRRLEAEDDKAAEVGRIVVGSSIKRKTLERVSPEIKLKWDTTRATMASLNQDTTEIMLVRSRLMKVPFAVVDLASLVRSREFPVGAGMATLWAPFDVSPKRVLKRLQSEMQRLAVPGAS